ncbi:MAG: hypothetical protein UH685_02885 [Bacteroidaceae bacterium]|nr:hypothetical protein [Bacteroidaceae bacterium]
MKNKITKLFMLLVAAASMGAFVSCKDTNEDLYNELRTELINENTTLAEALNNRIGELEGKLSELEAWKAQLEQWKESINSCNCPGNVQELINNLNIQIQEINNYLTNVYTKGEVDEKVQTLTTMIVNINQIISTLATLDQLTDLQNQTADALDKITQTIDNLKAELEKAKCECDPAKFQEVLDRLATLETQMAKAIEDIKVATKTAQDALTLAEKNKEAIEELQNRAGELENAIKDLDGKIADNTKAIAENAENIQKNLENIQKNAETIEKIQKSIEELENKITLASTNAEQALKDAAAAQAKADENAQKIEDLTKRVENNEKLIETLQGSLEALTTTVSGLKDQADSNTERITALENALKETNDKVGDLTEKYNQLSTEVDNLKEQLQNCQETCKKNLEDAMTQIRTEMQELYNALDERVTANETTIGELKTNVEALKTDVTDLQNRIQKAEETLDELTTKIERLTGDIEAIQEYLSKQVTSIIIQGTHNPLFGSLSIPGTDIMSTSLVAFYGLPVSDVEFPTSDDANYVRKSEALTDKDMEMLGGLEVFEAPANLPLLNEGGNAGKVYVTINPSSADLTGLKLSLVNTLDEESPIKLSPIKKCEEKLQSGWTRANNGFYVAEASVTPKTVMTENGGLNINKENFSELFKETKEQFGDLAKDFDAGKLNLSELATDVYSVIRELKVDKSGLKCTYTTTDADGTEKEHSVYSQYNLAATFLNPLNLKWGKDFNYVTMPGYELADSLLNRFSNTLKDQVDVILNDVINIDGMQDFIGHFQIDELTYLGEASELISRFEARVSHIVLNGIGYQLEVPGAGAFDVKFNKNLTANGAAVSIPAEVAYDEDNVTLYRAAVVIGGDIVNGMTVTLVVPARGVEDEVVAAYASILLAEESVSVTVSGNQITMTTTDGEYTIANVNGTSINTDDCTDRLILRDVAGNGGSLRLPIAVEISNELRDLIERQGGTINDIVSQLNDMLKNINDYQGTINGWIDNGVDNYLKKYLDLINKNVVDFVNSINRRFGPFMVASNNNKGFKYLSSSKSYPTVLSADGLAIYPTTKNMELIVPLARKHVAVTNVFKGNESAQNGNADCKARLQAINGTEKLNTVIDGTVRKIDVSNMVSGYTYEIAYSVLDFEGNISTQKYYVTIK